VNIDPLARFAPATRDWFTGTFAAPTPAQEQAWSAIGDGEHVITGSAQHYTDLWGELLVE
jgi:Lhr-like helicase